MFAHFCVGLASFGSSPDAAAMDVGQVLRFLKDKEHTSLELAELEVGVLGSGLAATDKDTLLRCIREQRLEPRSRKRGTAQDWTLCPMYFDADTWRLLLGEGVADVVRLEKVASRLAGMGLRRPSEGSVAVVAASACLDKPRQAMVEQYDLYCTAKETLHLAMAKDGASKAPADLHLPADPAQASAVVRAAVEASPPVPPQYNIPEFLRRAKLIPCRSSNRFVRQQKAQAVAAAEAQQQQLGALTAFLPGLSLAALGAHSQQTQRAGPAQQRLAALVDGPRSGGPRNDLLAIEDKKTEGPTLAVEAADRMAAELPGPADSGTPQQPEPQQTEPQPGTPPHGFEASVGRLLQGRAEASGRRKDEGVLKKPAGGGPRMASAARAVLKKPSSATGQPLTKARRLKLRPSGCGRCRGVPGCCDSCWRKRGYVV